MWRLEEERLLKKQFKMNLVLELRDLTPPERAKKILELAGMEFNIPFSSKTGISKSTLYNWLREYSKTKDQTDLLKHKVRVDRGTYRHLTKEQKNALAYWREQNLYRTCGELRDELLSKNLLDAKGGVPSESTIARYLRGLGLDRRTLLLKDKKAPSKSLRLPFEAPYPQRLWQADTKGPHFYVKDPNYQGGICFEYHGR